MKSFGCFALLLCFCVSARAELDTLWTHQVDLTEFNWSIDAATVLQDGSIMAAASRSDGGSVDLWRYGLSGELEWTGQVSFPSAYISLIGMEQYSDGQIGLLGIYWISGEDSGNFVHLKRFTVNGEELGDDSYHLTGPSWSGGLTSLNDNTIVLLMSRSDASGNTQLYITKFDADGDTLWSRHVALETTYSDGRAMAVFDNGDFLLAGSYSSQSFAIQAFAMRVTPQGSTVWTRTYESISQTMLVANAVDIDRNGNVVIGGTDGGFWGSSARPWVVGLDENGNQRWVITNTENIDIGVNGIKTTMDGGAIIAGSSFSDFGFNHSDIYTVNNFGEPNLELSFEDQSAIRGMSNDGPRGSILFGTRQNSEFLNDGLLIRFSPSTRLQGFVRAAGSNTPLEHVRVELLETNEFTYTDVQGIYNLGLSVNTGTLRLTSPCTTPRQETVTLVEGEQNVRNYSLGIPQFDNPITSINRVVTLDMWEHDTLTVYNDGNGTLQFWTEAVEQVPTNYEWLRVSPAIGEIPPNSSAEIVISVGAQSAYPDIELFGQARIHHNACPDTVNEIGVYTLALDAPERPSPADKFTLHPAYPNPFNAEARVAFDLPQTAQVIAKLYTVQGREAATLTDRVYDAGSHELSISGSNLATGVYLLRLSAGSSVATQKLVLLK